jgi:hypothetical protein
MVGRTERNYLIDFCASWICETDRSLSEVDMEAVIEGRIAEYDARGFKLGIYYSRIVTKAAHKRLIKAIKKQVEQRRYYRKIINDLKPKRIESTP